MTQSAENFMDAWLQANVVERTLNPRITIKGLVRRCAAAARKSGLTIDELEAVVGNLEQAITDELSIKGTKSVSATQ